MDIWSKLIPTNPTIHEFSREDIGLMVSTRAAINEFRHNIFDYLSHLKEYIQMVKTLAPMKLNY